MNSNLSSSELINTTYAKLVNGIAHARHILRRPLTYTEKLLYPHTTEFAVKAYKRGEDYVDFNPDRIAMQDATAQMALLQFMTCGMSSARVPVSVHCDHLIQAHRGAAEDLATAKEANDEVYTFLQNASGKYGIAFWGPGSGIIHQVVLENYAFPGGMMIGTDSHTPNAGGLGMIAIGVGGADAVDVMVGLPWELRMPKMIGVKLTGKLNGWTAPKDVILKLAGILSVKGGTGSIIEYFGDGVETLSCTGKATICNMGAELGATCSLFPYDQKMAEYLIATGRNNVASKADLIAEHLRADQEVYDNPEMYFDQLVEIDLTTLEPYINGPFTPDLAVPISQMADKVREHGWPDAIEVALIGSCTNSSYEDISRAASVMHAAQQRGIQLKSEFTITPGSAMVHDTIERDGFLKIFTDMGGTVLANACGPCIGQWARHITDPTKKNTIITSFNRNFAKRNDGLSSTHAFVASPEIVTALALAGSLSFNPLKDKLINERGEEMILDEPQGYELPTQGFSNTHSGALIVPLEEREQIDIDIDPESMRLQKLQPFAPWEGIDLFGLKVLIKVQGKCTTDHISAAGQWLKYRGHLDNISNNMLIGATNVFNGEINLVKNQITGEYDSVPNVQRFYKSQGIGSIVIGDGNYGEGSSREHAAMEPRYLGVRAIISREFARIHETNLKKQGMLALTFADKADYEKIQEDDTCDILGLNTFAPGEPLYLILTHADGSEEKIELCHTYNDQQIEWFKAGGALNVINMGVRK